jgi:predicted site-specific integrase-resolvase
MKNKLLDGLADVPEAARRMRLRPETVYRYFNKGLIRPTRIGRSVFVDVSEIARYNAERRKVGRQFRKKSSP